MKLLISANPKHKLFIFTSLSLLVLLIPFKVEAQTAPPVDIIINASVPACVLNITVKPEKRIPPVNNWSTIVDMSIYHSDDSTLLVSLTVTTDNFGKADIDLCALNITPTAGNYDFYIRGYSTLRKLYKSIYTFDLPFNSIDFSQNAGLLLNGETSIVYDNYINALDVSTQINKIYTSDSKNDLNHDGLVNSLDISNTIANLFKQGD